ncbi:tRNA (guanosine(46)-N7)-methyltransferase TrmB [Dermatophilus congolensis]|uniref:tRNA (guanosine(46)-N7)-methyltransferase TrmB n=1 Tax=Dermatophilus congolensis TaxID=1863 RepID=UPI001AAF94DA|nr:tRNA (guanosine(46)-N7)-methyltransferase TrmB [Dermatophilus congolensis]MBO3129257.1 tRNA (guanosine(46)-N7)-methyltransferase TrmB [Dermatophilus congolensis]MBO3132111.1 tRNA (guanosine(46)-N7)-methyltransferase TrmB [Dermatophilus congolensis]MBO3133733.1 tRNA (guanosine(46)-N7)-methyltransferase TrmB [Dermatophilus congolensis]MBO3135964.1 tRNA (guanosine(46)-N7)-methyltransferase TrmB [Dermatophilus congolensis]MBO3138206.1 tRNA (guanosine(46)-N7)-methyltransferase TrmB [Dermatophilu
MTLNSDTAAEAAGQGAPEERVLIPREVLSFARRDGRYSTRNAKAWTPQMQGWFVTPERDLRLTSIAPQWRFDAQAVFGRSAPLIAEVGSGTGDAVLAHAEAFPDADHVALEVYRPGLARTVVQAEARGLSNLRVLEGDGRALIANNVEPGTFSEIHVWFPDPWPKTKHHKRRLVDVGFFEDVARVLAAGGVVRLATDWAPYAVVMSEAAAQVPALSPIPGAVTAMNDPQAHDDPTAAVSARSLYGQSERYAVRPLTRFESKGRALGRPIADLAYMVTPTA